MRISDWCSDVCSSDLGRQGAGIAAHLRRQAAAAIQAEQVERTFTAHFVERLVIGEVFDLHRHAVDEAAERRAQAAPFGLADGGQLVEAGGYPAVTGGHAADRPISNRPEERSVGQEWVRTCRSTWQPDHSKKKIKHQPKPY